MHPALFVLFICLLLSACAQTQTVHCDTPVAEVAYQTGTQGKAFDSILHNYPKQCQQDKNSIKLQRYSQQHQKGIQEYCTQNQALQLGLDGKPYEGVCDQDFTQAYLKGKRRYELQQKIKQRDGDNEIPTFNNQLSPRHFEH